MNIKKNLKELQQFQSISVSDLKEGTEFKLLGQRKWRKAAKVIHNLPSPCLGKTLIILENCGQLVFPPEVSILINSLKAKVKEDVEKIQSSSAL